MPYAGHHLACPELVNSHLLLLLPASHLRPVEDHNEPGDGVEVGDGVGRVPGGRLQLGEFCFTILRTFESRIRPLWDASHRIS
jgi:hypothetical protein